MLRFWRRCGGGVAHGRRFQAALQLFRTSVSFFFLCFGLLFFFPSLSSLSLFFFPLFFSLFFSPLGFSLLSGLPLSLLCFFFLFFSFFPISLLFPSFSFFLSSPLLFSSAFLASIYRGQGCCFLQLSWGSSRLVGHWARLPRFGGWCAVVGRPLCPVGGLQARVAGKNSKKSNLFSFFPAA